MNMNIPTCKSGRAYLPVWEYFGMNQGPSSLAPALAWERLSLSAHDRVCVDAGWLGSLKLLVSRNVLSFRICLAEAMSAEFDKYPRPAS